ncbi:MAG: VanW family protein, partial [Myxococcota bacterium]
AGGLEVDLEADPETEARRLARRYAGESITLRFGRHRIVRTRAALGVHVDAAHLQGLLEQAGDPRSVLRRWHEQRRGDTPLELPMPTRVDADAVEPRLLALKDVVDEPAAPARMDTQAKTLVPAQPGLHLHVAGTLDRLADAARTGARKLEVRVDREGPDHDAKDLAEVRMDAVLGEFETPYNASRKAADRTHNLRVAARKLDGRILMPGEVLDFNEVVGDRGEANGFRPAPVIEGGELVDGVGGGACQVAGTLHAAAFFAGLPILERLPHSRPSTYIKLGLDAAVSYPKLNFRFENDLPDPVVLDLRVEGGTARARLWGTKRTRQVTFKREVLDVTPFEARVKEDPDLPEGVRVRTQRGVPGFEIRRRRLIEEAGRDEVREQENVNRYPPTTEVWHVGTGEPPPDDYEPPEGDTHPEYVADEKLAMVQGPGIDGTEEHRRQGRTGVYGWIEREEMGPDPDEIALNED